MWTERQRKIQKEAGKRDIERCWKERCRKKDSKRGGLRDRKRRGQLNRNRDMERKLKRKIERQIK